MAMVTKIKIVSNKTKITKITSNKIKGFKIKIEIEEVAVVTEIIVIKIKIKADNNNKITRIRITEIIIAQKLNGITEFHQEGSNNNHNNKHSNKVSI